MKTTFCWVVGILAATWFLFGCQDIESQAAKPKPCNCKKTFTIQKCGDEKGKTKTITTSYNCRQLVVTFKGKLHPEGEKYLKDKGFHKVKSCPCAPELQLWENSSDQSLDLIGVITGGNPPPDIVGGLALNIEIDLPDRVKFDSFQTNADFDTSQWQKQSSPVRVAIIDSGVDAGNSYLSGFLVSNASACGNVLAFPYGINMLDFSQPPFDEHGHGTMVNGVLAGIPEFAIGQPLQKKSPVELLNIKFTSGHSKSGSLFDAVCGAYYAIQQGAVVIYASCGYYDTVPPAMMDPLLTTMGDDVVMVAGMGNDELDLTGDKKFWPAAFAETHSNVIAVGALNKNQDALATFSNRADTPRMTLTAWGEDIVSAHLTTGTDKRVLAMDSGTSYATPMVSRSLAFMIDKQSAPASALKNHLVDKASDNVPGANGQPFKKLEATTAISDW
ncbi:MAG: S8/S53 family peptidase [Bacteroidota bacterium]